MKKIFVIILFIATGLLQSKGKDYSFNLSSINKGDQAERCVWVVNTSEGPVSIVNIETGCVCTKASFDRKPIPVGDSTKVNITFSAKDPGVFYKVVLIKTTDTDCDSKVTIRGRVLTNGR